MTLYVQRSLGVHIYFFSGGSINKVFYMGYEALDSRPKTGSPLASNAFPFLICITYGLCCAD